MHRIRTLPFWGCPKLSMPTFLLAFSRLQLWYVITHGKIRSSFCMYKMSSRIVIFFLLWFSLELDNYHNLVAAKNSVYIVYMGGRQHDDVELATTTHHQMLTAVVGSEAASAESMIYSYRHGFSGFAAKLSKSQAQKLSEFPGVVQVIPNHILKPLTTRSWDYLGLFPGSPANLLQRSNASDGVIIGLLDTGVWPESKAYNDKGLGPIPSHWKGGCDSGEHFIATKHCNKKLIGARYFIKGLLAVYNKPLNTTETQEFLSPRDSTGHGTHTSSTAAGFFIPNVSYNGLGFGTVRGGAPNARIAMYKVCWDLLGGVCAAADMLKAFDEAIKDGVDVLSVSIGSTAPEFSDVEERSSISIGSFHAVVKGVTVVCAAGNGGPSSHTISNTAPWIITVAASSIDRDFPTAVRLGNNFTFLGEAKFIGKDTTFMSLMYPEQEPVDLLDPIDCDSLSTSRISMTGKVVLCFTKSSNLFVADDAAYAVREAGGKGVIVARSPNNAVISGVRDFPYVQVNFEIGTLILRYIKSDRCPTVRFSPSKTLVGQTVSTNVAYFSSRGPNSISPAILKPDVAAPGVNILAAYSPSASSGEDFVMDSGTSMATPHVSGIVALLKSLHPDWSPAAIKSSIVTTARTTDPEGEPIFSEGHPSKIADPFDFGGGIINPNRATDPGLVYDMGLADYIQYLCAMRYDDTSISNLVQKPTFCPKNAPSILDLNLPSITIPSLKHYINTTVTRTVTNVGPSNSKYKAVVELPKGMAAVVNPEMLFFNSSVKSISFSVSFSSTRNTNTGFLFGSLTWISDGNRHSVRIPISVRSVAIEVYTC